MRSIYQQHHEHPQQHQWDTAAGEDGDASVDDPPVINVCEDDSPVDAMMSHNIESTEDDEEARQLYEWTQTLSIEDFAMTPRIGSC